MAAQTPPVAVDQSNARAQLLEDLVHLHGPLLRRDSARHTRCPADADAAFSEACFRFLAYFQGSDDIDHALRWLRVAIKHAVRRHLEAQHRERPSADLEEHVAFDSIATHPVDDLDRLEQLDLLAALKPAERIALLLFAAGYSYREIAELRDWTYTKVNRCIAEGRAALRRMQGGEK